MSKKSSSVSIWLVLVLLVVGALTYLVGPSLWSSSINPFRAPTPFEIELEKVKAQEGAQFNFRTSLVIETPDGLVEGSVVRTTTVRYSPYFAGSGGTLRSFVQGEALAMEVLPGKWLFGLVQNPAEPPEYYGGGSGNINARDKDVRERALVFYNSAPEGLGRDIVVNPQTVYEKVPEDAHWSEKDAIQDRNRQLLQEAPRETFPGTLVTFTDINDPSTIELVDLADLETTFGEGVKFVSGRYEYTTAPRTEGEILLVLPFRGALNILSNEDLLNSAELSKTKDGWKLYISWQNFKKR